MGMAMKPKPFFRRSERHPLADDVAEVIGHPLRRSAARIGKNFSGEETLPAVVLDGIEWMRQVPGYVAEAIFVLNVKGIVGAVVGVQNVETALEQLYCGVERGFGAEGPPMVEVIGPFLCGTELRLSKQNEDCTCQQPSRFLPSFPEHLQRPPRHSLCSSLPMSILIFIL